MALIGLDSVVASYDPGLVFVHLGFPASLEVRGLADVPGAVRIASPPRWASARGCDGEKFRRRLPARDGVLQLILMQTSVQLDLLTGVRLLDQLTGLGSFPLAVVDGNGSGNRFAMAERAWMEGPPSELDLSPKPTALVYTFQVDGLEIVIGSLRRAR